MSFTNFIPPSGRQAAARQATTQNNTPAKRTPSQDASSTSGVSEKKSKPNAEEGATSAKFSSYFGMISPATIPTSEDISPQTKSTTQQILTSPLWPTFLMVNQDIRHK